MTRTLTYASTTLISFNRAWAERKRLTDASHANHARHLQAAATDECMLGWRSIRPDMARYLGRHRPLWLPMCVLWTAGEAIRNVSVAKGRRGFFGQALKNPAGSGAAGRKDQSEADLRREGRLRSRIHHKVAFF
jgi:hypothetical protein